MTLTLQDVLIATALISCVPLQYILVHNWGKAETGRSYALNKFIQEFISLKDELLSLSSWQRWLTRKLQWDGFPADPPEVDPDEGESPAVEVMNYKHKHGYFSFSPEIRHIHPPHVQFKIGQIVVHKNFRYRGVVVGWDENAKAPPEWLDQMHKENKEWREMPNYSILVDTRDRLIPQLTYVPQVNLELIEKTQIIHPLVENHFEDYDGTQYIPRPWLGALYPQG